jgi:lysine 2,3-aminomutase
MTQLPSEPIAKSTSAEATTTGPKLRVLSTELAALPRAANKADASHPSWNDWQWQMRQALATAQDFEPWFALSARETEGLRLRADEGLPVAVTPYYARLIDPTDEACAIRKQVVPWAEEANVVEGDLVDPLGEVAHEVAPHLVQRYPDRVLLLATDRCAVYCRFCTRSRMVGDGGGVVSLEKLQPAFNYIQSTPSVRDVIISGGDPLTLSTRRLTELVSRVRQIAHVDTIRLATRVPVTLPMRITDELLDALAPLHPLWIMTHFNHPKELTLEAKQALTKLADRGFPVMNQTVLLRGINDQPAILEELFRGLIRVRARPYYLLQMDPVVGTSHLRTPLRRGMEIMAELQGRLTSIALPKFVCDTPEGKGKVPLMQTPIVQEQPGRTVLRTFRAEEVTYIDPPDDS